MSKILKLYLHSTPSRVCFWVLPKCLDQLLYRIPVNIYFCIWWSIWESVLASPDWSENKPTFFSRGFCFGERRYSSKHFNDVSTLLLSWYGVASGLQLYEKGDSGTGVFLWILRNFKEHLFLQNTSSGCFCWSFLLKAVNSFRKKIDLRY